MWAYHGSSVCGYGIIKLGNSVGIVRAFRAKECVRAMSDADYTDCCKPLFNKYNHLQKIAVTKINIRSANKLLITKQCTAI